MTPFLSDEGFTPSGGSSRGEEGTLTEEKIDAIGEKLTRKKSFGHAILAPVTSQTTKAASGGLSEEQSAQGRVKVTCVLALYRGSVQSRVLPLRVYGRFAAGVPDPQYVRAEVLERGQPGEWREQERHEVPLGVWPHRCLL